MEKTEVKEDYSSRKPVTSSTYHPPRFATGPLGSLDRPQHQCEPPPTPYTPSTSPGPSACSWFQSEQFLTPGGAPCPLLRLPGRPGSSSLSPHGGCLWVVPPSSPWCWWSWGWANARPGEELKGLMGRAGGKVMVRWGWMTEDRSTDPLNWDGVTGRGQRSKFG